VSEIKLSTAAADGRIGTEAAPRAPRRVPVSRHGTISRELMKYSNYKSWADKVRTAWRIENGEEPAESPPGAPRR